MDMIIKIPQAPKAKVMLWTDVSYHDMEELDKLQSIPDLESALCGLFQVDLPEPRRGIQLELYVQTLLFCRERSFRKEQTSALLSIIKSIHELNVATPLNNIKQCYEYSKELLFCHSVRRPPFSVDLFSSEEVSCVFNYIQNNYMRHYKLYKYIFTPQVKLDLSLTYTEIPERPAMEDPSAAVENIIEKDAEAKRDVTPETQETSTTEPEGAEPGSKSELKALIEQEVREQMMLVSGKLDQRVKEIADQHNNALESLQPKHRAKKSS